MAPARVRFIAGAAACYNTPGRWGLAAGEIETPMFRQYRALKEAHPGHLLFYRMGDFYELFFEDAVKAAPALDIALTRRGQHNGAEVPMCGVPVHSAETYLHRLIRKGFKVAICEQTEDPAEARRRGGSKALVRREVVRIVTPGTLTEDGLLEARPAEDDDVAMGLLTRLSQVSRRRWPADFLPRAQRAPVAQPSTSSARRSPDDDRGRSFAAYIERSATRSSSSRSTPSSG
jgi:hypothetical protein